MRERASWPARDWEVRAIIAGRKTQARRPLNPQPDAEYGGEPYWFIGGYRVWPYRETSDPLRQARSLLACPHGKPWDRLWLREAWQYYDWSEDGGPCIRYAADNAVAWPKIDDELTAQRVVDAWAGLSSPDNVAIDGRARDRRWRLPIHMPRWASRITLEVVGVRVERLQDISEAAAIAEGGVEVAGWPGWWSHTGQSPSDKTPKEMGFGGTARDSYRTLWESTNGPGSWDANPWVWAVEFRTIGQPFFSTGWMGGNEYARRSVKSTIGGGNV